MFFLGSLYSFYGVFGGFLVFFRKGSLVIIAVRVLVLGIVFSWFLVVVSNRFEEGSSYESIVFFCSGLCFILVLGFLEIREEAEVEGEVIRKVE